MEAEGQEWAEAGGRMVGSHYGQAGDAGQAERPIGGEDRISNAELRRLCPGC